MARVRYFRASKRKFVPTLYILIDMKQRKYVKKRPIITYKRGKLLTFIAFLRYLSNNAYSNHYIQEIVSTLKPKMA